MAGGAKQAKVKRVEGQKRLLRRATEYGGALSEKSLLEVSKESDEHEATPFGLTLLPVDRPMPVANAWLSIPSETVSATRTSTSLVWLEPVKVIEASESPSEDVAKPVQKLVLNLAALRKEITDPRGGLVPVEGGISEPVSVGTKR